MTRSAFTGSFVPQPLVTITCDRQSGAVNGLEQKVACCGFRKTANNPLLVTSRVSPRKLDRVKTNKATVRLALTFLIFLGFYLPPVCSSYMYTIMFFGNIESFNSDRIFFSTNNLFLLPQQVRGGGGSFFFAEASGDVRRSSLSDAPKCQSLEDLAQDSILNIEDLTSDNSGLLSEMADGTMYPPVGSAGYTVSLSYGWEASGEYFCGPDAPSHLACDCSILKVCDSAADPWGRQMGVCGCCAAWVYGLIIAFAIFIVLVALTGFAILCCNGKSWFNGHPDPKIPLRPTRTAAIVAPAGSPLPQSAFLGFDSRDFSDLPVPNNESNVGWGAAGTIGGTDADGLRNRRQMNLSGEVGHANERTTVFANRDPITTTRREAHSLLTLQQRERPVVASLYDVYFHQNLNPFRAHHLGNRGELGTVTTQQNEADDESPYVYQYHYLDDSRQLTTSTSAHATGHREEQRHLSQGTIATDPHSSSTSHRDRAASSRANGAPPHHDRGALGSGLRYPTTRPSLSSAAAVNSPFDIDEARSNLARQRQERQESTPHDQTHTRSPLPINSDTNNDNPANGRPPYDYVYTNSNNNSFTTNEGIRVSPFSPPAVPTSCIDRQEDLRESGGVAPPINHRSDRNPLGSSIGQPNGNTSTRGTQRRGLGAATTSAPYGVVGRDAFPSRELLRSRNPIDAGEPFSDSIDDGHEPFASTCTAARGR